jgi:hypothetical protein
MPPAWIKTRSPPGQAGTAGAPRLWSPTPSSPSPPHSNAPTAGRTPGLIPLSYHELLSLLRLLMLPMPRRDAEHVLAWSAWRRRHQHRVRTCHLHWHAYADTNPSAPPATPASRTTPAVAILRTRSLILERPWGNDRKEDQLRSRQTRARDRARRSLHSFGLYPLRCASLHSHRQAVPRRSGLYPEDVMASLATEASVQSQPAIPFASPCALPLRVLIRWQ